MAEFKKATNNEDNVIVNEDFDNFLDETCTGDVGKRKERFLRWQSQPGGLDAHPRNEADHFMPLIMNAGAGGSKPGKKIFSDVFISKFKLSGYIWNDE